MSSLEKKIESIKSKSSLKPFAARFAGDELKDLKASAKRIGISMNSLVRVSVAEMIEKYKKK